MEELYPAFKQICLVGIIFGAIMIPITIAQAIFSIKFMNDFLKPRVPPMPPSPDDEANQ